MRETEAGHSGVEEILYAVSIIVVFLFAVRLVLTLVRGHKVGDGADRNGPKNPQGDGTMGGRQTLVYSLVRLQTQHFFVDWYTAEKAGARSLFTTN